MRKKTEPQTPKHPKTSRTEAGKKGLIAKEENLLRSARETCALDDHSHRTTKAQWQWANRTGARHEDHANLHAALPRSKSAEPIVHCSGGLCGIGREEPCG